MSAYKNEPVYSLPIRISDHVREEGSYMNRVLGTVLDVRGSYVIVQTHETPSRRLERHKNTLVTSWRYTPRA